MLKKLLNNASLLLVLTVTFWSGNLILARAVRNDIEPTSLAFWRWGIASIIALVLARKHLKKDLPIAFQSMPIMIVLSLTGITVFNTVMYVGLQHTNAINALLLQSFIPVCIVALSFIFFREKIKWSQLVGITTSLVGVVLIIGKADISILANLNFNIGDIYVFIAVVNYAVYSICLRKRPDIHSFSFLAICFVLGTLFLLPFHLYLSSTFLPPLSSAGVLSIGYVAIFPSIISYLCYNRGVQLAGASKAGVYIHLMPVFGSILAIILLGERLHWFHIVGICLIACGVFLAGKKD